ncbi:MAG: hypothetical protein DRJ03_02435 [Chloroflexi bacterium]|nr:MAG: hypothetical protein DRJ03_02435 [Chloroflexota bacterium]
MDSERIKEIQESTTYPESVSVQQALLKVWYETQTPLQKQLDKKYKEVEAYVGQLRELHRVKPESKSNLALLPTTSTRGMMRAGGKVTGSKHIYNAMVGHYLQHED